MKYLICFFVVFFISACGGSLTDEQRRKLKEGMEVNGIKKLSEARITEAAYTMGRSLALRVEKATFANKRIIDSLQQAARVKIILLQPGDSLLLEIEKQIVEAYSAGSGQVELNDNIQRLGADSILYTKPVMKKLPDGSVQFNYALGIRMTKKNVVLSIKD